MDIDLNNLGTVNAPPGLTPHVEKAREILYCKRCLMPNSRPRIVFDAHGVCNACLNSDRKPLINWDERRKEFEELIAPFRSKDGGYDCIVPFSGGKDSGSIAYRLKFDYGLNPLLVTFSPMIPNEVGVKNCESLIDMGFDNVYFRPNNRVQKHLAKRFFIERGNPKVCWDAGVNAVPVQVAASYNIPLVFYAEHGESEYGGKVLDERSQKIRDFTEVVEHQIGDDPRNWADDQVNQKDLEPYLYPSLEKIEKAGVTAMYFAYFHKWDIYENWNIVKDSYPFWVHPKGRTCGTFTHFDSLDDKIDDLYYYMQFIKFGFGRAVRDASRQIQNGHMSRAEGLALAQKYDGEFPADYFEEVLRFLDMSREEFTAVVDKHRNEEIWMQENGEWKLRFPLV